VANTLNLFRNGGVGFIDWLDVTVSSSTVGTEDDLRSSNLAR